jgi:dihydropteroate synthase
MPRQLEWQFGPHRRRLGEFPLLMGIVNVTPDSFSDGGRYLSDAAAVEHALQLAEEGADILDIGGESTRPGASPVSADEELRRVIPVIDRLRGQSRVPISIDTSKSEVARESLAAGATIVNDVSGLTFDPRIVEVCAASECGVVCMHIRGTPQTMQQDPRYNDVVSEVARHLAERVAALSTSGIQPERIVVDPGIGFGKTAEHNLQLLSAIGRFRAPGRPVLIGHSRKSFLKKIIGRAIDELLSGTIGVAIAAAMQSVDVLRVHDVGPVRDALLAWHAVAAQIADAP